MKTKFILMLVVWAVLLGYSTAAKQWVAIGPLLGVLNATYAWARLNSKYE